CPIVPTLQCGLLRSNFSFAISVFSFVAPAQPAVSLNQYRIFVFAAESFVVRAEKLFSLNQSVETNPALETLVLQLEPRAKTFKISVPSPKISRPILPECGNLAPELSPQIALSLPQ
ncbi:MAG: hypothetical protein WCA58_09410, partial [Terriglobales bacterium]